MGEMNSQHYIYKHIIRMQPGHLLKLPSHVQCTQVRMNHSSKQLRRVWCSLHYPSLQFLFPFNSTKAQADSGFNHQRERQVPHDTVPTSTGRQPQKHEKPYQALLKCQVCTRTRRLLPLVQESDCMLDRKSSIKYLSSCFAQNLSRGHSRERGFRRPRGSFAKILHITGDRTIGLRSFGAEGLAVLARKATLLSNQVTGMGSSSTRIRFKNSTKLVGGWEIRNDLGSRVVGTATRPAGKICCLGTQETLNWSLTEQIAYS